MAVNEQEIRDRFGARVRALREQQGYSQESFADHAGTHRTWVSAVERGTQSASLGSICEIADGLGLTASELLDGVHVRADA